MAESVEPALTGNGGSQTLARGLAALMVVVEASSGVTVAEVATRLGIHRSIAYRTLQTLLDFGLISRDSSKLYQPGARLATLSAAYMPALRNAAVPAMRELADTIGVTVSLFVAEGGRAVAIDMIVPTTVSHHFAFHTGMSTPMDRGAAAYALLSAGPALPGESAAVAAARKKGYALSAGEVESGLLAAAVPIATSAVRACLNVIVAQREQQQRAIKPLRACAKRVEQQLNSEFGAAGLTSVGWAANGARVLD